MKPVSQFELIKKISVASLVIYSIILSVILIKQKPETLLIGIDQYGTRLISDQDDRLLKAEKINFLKLFLRIYHTYDSDGYTTAISRAGDLMSQQYWNEKKPEFLQRQEVLKGKDYQRTAEIKDLRAIDSTAFEADLVVSEMRSLQETKINLRVEIQLQPIKRSQINAYPFEVVRYVEQVL
jgi:hypothetical protein